MLLGSESSPAGAVQSGRYQIRNGNKLPPKMSKELEDQSEQLLIQSTSVVVRNPVAATPTTTTTTSTTTTTTTTLPALVQQPTVVEQVKDLVADKDQPLIEAYKEQIHPDDTRLNQIEIDILAGAMSNSSASNYSYRNYNTISPQMSIGARLWMTPFLGLHGQYLTSIGADVISDAATRSRTTVQHEKTEIGFDLRRFFGMSRKANSLQYGLLFSEYKLAVPGTETHRVSIRSSGLGINLSARIPVAPTYAWTFGGKLIPRVQHKEQATGIDLSSGGLGESSRFDLSIGGEFKMVRQSQIIWELSVSHEKNQFNGQANFADPETGQKPMGVSVSNTLTVFSLGYRWGQ
jgi:hypothetical protein